MKEKERETHRETLNDRERKSEIKMEREMMSEERKLYIKNMEKRRKCLKEKK